MHSRVSGLHAVLIAAVRWWGSLAAPQRRPLRASSSVRRSRVTPSSSRCRALPRQVARASCRPSTPTTGDSTGSRRSIWVKSDSMPYPDEGGPNSPVLGHGTISAVRTRTTSAPSRHHAHDLGHDVLGLGLDVLVYHPKNLRFLDGAVTRARRSRGMRTSPSGPAPARYRCRASPRRPSVPSAHARTTRCAIPSATRRRESSPRASTRLRDRLREGGLGDDLPHRRSHAGNLLLHQAVPWTEVTSAGLRRQLSGNRRRVPSVLLLAGAVT
jgi:hypothetical protein